MIVKVEKISYWKKSPEDIISPDVTRIITKKKSFVLVLVELIKHSRAQDFYKVFFTGSHYVKIQVIESLEITWLDLLAP